MCQFGELGIHHLRLQDGRCAHHLLQLAQFQALLHLLSVALDQIERQAGCARHLLVVGCLFW